MHVAIAISPVTRHRSPDNGQKFCSTKPHHQPENTQYQMERWSGRVAIVTGASSGIGAAIVLELCRHGIITVGLARRTERIELLRHQLPAPQQSLLHARHCNVAIEADIVAAFGWIEERFGRCDILVNNAGVLKKVAITDADNTAMLRETVDVNFMGAVLCTREAFRLMEKPRGAVDSGGGHVILINSVVGHRVPFLARIMGSMNVYAPTKHAITALTEILRQEFQLKGTRTKVTVSWTVDKRMHRLIRRLWAIVSFRFCRASVPELWTRKSLSHQRPRH